MVLAATFVLAFCLTQVRTCTLGRPVACRVRAGATRSSPPMSTSTSPCFASDLQCTDEPQYDGASWRSSGESLEVRGVCQGSGACVTAGLVAGRIRGRRAVLGSATVVSADERECPRRHERRPRSPTLLFTPVKCCPSIGWSTTSGVATLCRVRPDGPDVRQEPAPADRPDPHPRAPERSWSLPARPVQPSGRRAAVPGGSRRGWGGVERGGSVRQGV